MRDLILERTKEEMIAAEKRKATLETLQFGAYGVGQGFELEVVGGEMANVISANSMINDVKSFIDTTDELQILQKNRVDSSLKRAERFNESYRAWLNLTSSHINGGQIEEAKKALEKAIELAPDEKSVKAMAGRIKILEGKIPEALGIYEELATKKKDIAAKETVAILKMAIGNVDEAIDDLTNAFDEDRKGRISLLYNLGIAYLVKRKCGRAISYFRKVLAKNPNYHIAYSGMGVAYTMLGIYKKAEKMFRIAVDKEPSDINVRLNLARVLVVQKHIDGAIKLLIKLIQDFPRHWQAREELAVLYLEIGRFEEAQIHFDKILDAIESGDYKGNLSNGLNNVGITLMFKGLFDESEKVLKQSIMVSERKNIKAMSNLVRVYLLHYKLEKARVLLEELAGIASNNTEIMSLRTSYMYMSEEYEEAIKEAKKVLEIDPNNLTAASHISIMKADVYDDFAGAEAVLRPLESEHGNNIKYLNNLAYVLILWGKVQEGRTLLERIERQEPYDNVNSVFATATLGLLNVRRGNLAEGSRLYNAAAKQAGYPEFSKQILQKKELEIGRWFKDIANKEKSIMHLEKAYKIDVNDKIFTRKAKELIEAQR